MSWQANASQDESYIQGLIDMNYEWDENKAVSNLRKHGIRFSDASAVFEDEMALSREDIDALGEQRFVATFRIFWGVF